MGDADNPVEIIEQTIAAGTVDLDLVEAARVYWRQHLRDGVVMPNGERITVSYRDLHHVLDDERILPKPFRIGRVLAGVFEIRSAKWGRRLGLSQWDEEGEHKYGYVILDPNQQVRTMHMVNQRGIRKKARRGELLWPRNELQ